VGTCASHQASVALPAAAVEGVTCGRISSKLPNSRPPGHSMFMFTTGPDLFSCTGVCCFVGKQWRLPTGAESSHVAVSGVCVSPKRQAYTLPQCRNQPTGDDQAAGCKCRPNEPNLAITCTMLCLTSSHSPPLVPALPFSHTNYTHDRTHTQATYTDGLRRSPRADERML
jgi:hypothetical protein